MFFFFFFFFSSRRRHTRWTGDWSSDVCSSDLTEEMLEITAGRHPHLLLPTFDDLGVPCGIDVRKVVETAIVPWITTGIAHRQAGVGQIGAGVVQAPLECFVQALEAFATAY